MAENDFGARSLRVMRARSGGRCEGCGGVFGYGIEAHHRLFRSRGGMGGAANGLLLHGFGNADGCHGRAHSGEGPELGWAVSAGADPQQVPVRLARFGLVLLTDDGLVLAAEGSSCWAHSSEFASGKAGCRDCVPVGRVLWEFEEEKGWSE